jgi:DNA-binding MarR family transcriptional regulator
MSNRASDTARVMDALRRSVRALRSANDGAKRRFGIGAAQLFVLREMRDSPGISVAELADRTHSSESSVSEVVSRLVTRGYARKASDTKDGRRRVLEPTEQGAAIARSTAVSVQQRLIAGLRALSEADRRRLADLYESWLRAAGLETLPAPMFFASGPARSSNRNRTEGS